MAIAAHEEKCKLALGNGTYQLSLKVTGKVKRTRTASPLCLPGVQLGMLRTMRSA